MKHLKRGLTFSSVFFENRMFVVLVIINMVVAVSGFIKDVVTAAYVGTGVVADGFTFAYFVVDTLGNGVLAGGLLTGAAATFGRLSSHGHPLYIRTLHRNVLLWLGVGSCLIFLMLMFGVHGIGLALPASQTKSYALLVYSLMLPIIVLFPLYALFTGALQGVRRFVAGAVAPAIFNFIVFVVTLFLLMNQIKLPNGVKGMSLAIDVGALAMVLVVVINWSRIWNTPERPRLPLKKREAADEKYTELGTKEVNWTRNLWERSGGYMIYLAAAQSVGLIERSIALHLAVGSVAAFTYAYRLSQLPVWVVISAVGTILVPNLSASAELGESVRIRKIIERNLRLTVLIAVPCALILFELRYPIVEVLFQHGRFNTLSSQMTCKFLSTYAFALFGQSVAVTLFRAAFALGRIRCPIVAAICGSALSIGFDLMFSPDLGPYALGIGQLAGSVLSSAIIWGGLLREWRGGDGSGSHGIQTSKHGMHRLILKIAILNICILLLLIPINRILRHIDIGLHPFLKAVSLAISLIILVALIGLGLRFWVNHPLEKE